MPSPYSGMTINERLHEAGLREGFDAAASRKDRDAMIRLLTRVDVEPGDAERSVALILADPSKYGFE
jgi:hypothetical protein